MKLNQEMPVGQCRLQSIKRLLDAERSSTPTFVHTMHRANPLPADHLLQHTTSPNSRLLLPLAANPVTACVIAGIWRCSSTGVV